MFSYDSDDESLMTSCSFDNIDLNTVTQSEIFPITFFSLKYCQQEQIRIKCVIRNKEIPKQLLLPQFYCGLFSYKKPDKNKRMIGHNLTVEHN